MIQFFNSGIHDTIDMISGLKKIHRVIAMIMSELRDILDFKAEKVICNDNAIHFDRLHNG